MIGELVRNLYRIAFVVLTFACADIAAPSRTSASLGMAAIAVDAVSVVPWLVEPARSHRALHDAARGVIDLKAVESDPDEADVSCGVAEHLALRWGPEPDPRSVRQTGRAQAQIDNSELAMGTRLARGPPT